MAPFGLEVISLKLPIVNTLILLTSGATITVAHLAIIKKNKELSLDAFSITIFLALIFTFIQLYEYTHSPFSISDGIFGTVFFLLKSP